MGHGFEMLYFFHVVIVLLYLSSPYLFVFGDNHVTCYTGADVDAGEHVDA